MDSVPLGNVPHSLFVIVFLSTLSPSFISLQESEKGCEGWTLESTFQIRSSIAFPPYYWLKKKKKPFEDWFGKVFPSFM